MSETHRVQPAAANKVRWGILGAAKIATEKVIPAMQQGRWCEIAAIASRDGSKAEHAARRLGIPRAYGSYDELLAAPDIEAVYNPLPNHLHVPWSMRALEAGKHVLCEKPIALSAAEAGALAGAARRAGKHVQEAFMVRVHPQWARVVELIQAGRIGPVRTFSGFFSYFNDDPQNVRNIAEWGGGALLDIGCYLVNTARWIFRREPARVLASMERDRRFGTDVLSSVVLDFAPGHAVGTCATQLAPFQRVIVHGERGWIEIEIPFNAPPDRPCRIVFDTGADLFGGGREELLVEACNQYTIQGDRFSEVIRGLHPPVYPLDDSLRNMEAIDALFRSAESGRWESL